MPRVAKPRLIWRPFYEHSAKCLEKYCEHETRRRYFFIIMHQISDKCCNIQSVAKVYELKSQPSYSHNIQTSPLKPLGQLLKAKFYVKHLYNGGTNVYIYNLGHMTKMAAMPIYGKNPSIIFFSETNRLCVKHRWLKYYNLYINHDPVMTLTQFMARSAWVAHAFEWGNLLKCHLKGKASRKLANGQY